MNNDFCAEEVLRNGYKNAEKMLNKPDKIEQLLKRMKQKLDKLPFANGQFAFLPKMAMLVNNFIRKQYTRVPVTSIIAIIAAIAYFVLPIDAIPDFIPVVGFLDDIGVISLVIKQINSELKEYMDWRIQMGFDH